MLIRLLCALALVVLYAAPALAQTCAPGESRGAPSDDGKVRVLTVTGTSGTGTGAGTLNKRVADLKAQGWQPIGNPTNTTAQLWCAVDAPTTTPPIPPPVPVDCVLSAWSEWRATSQPTACVNGSQTRTEERTRTVLTQPSNGGLACGPLTETRTASLSCTVTPPPTQPPAGVVFQNGWEGQTATGCGLSILKDGTAWNDYGPSSTCTNSIAEIAVIPGRSGVLSRTLVVTMRPDGSQNGPDFRIDRGLPQRYTDVYAAWDFGYSPNWVFAGSDHKVTIFGDTSTGQIQNIYYNIRGNGNGPCGRVAIHVISSNTVLSDPDVQVCPGWHRGEIHYVAGSSGRIEAKVNGRLLNLRSEAGNTANPNSLNTGSGINYFKLDTTYNAYSYPSSLKLTMQMWFDNVAIATGGWIGQ